ncbi:MAG: motility associated factor glycosyltransferase family protein [bacterium]
MSQSIWENNLAALKRRDPELALRLEQVAVPNAQVIVARARDSSVLLGLTLEGGQRVAFAHNQTPGIEAEDWISSLGETFLKRAHVLLLGFASLYHPKFLFQLSDAETVIWYVEPEPVLFRYALMVMDFRDLISSSRVFFSIGEPAQVLAQRLFTGVTSSRMLAQGIRVASHGLAGRIYAGYIQELKAAIEENLQFGRIRFNTSEVQGHHILRNILGNLRYVFQGAPWLNLLGKAAGVPALVVAPGPSLEGALESIAAVRERVLVIAVDTAHRILHQNGVGSDIVVSLDYTELNKRHFENIRQDDAVLLAFPGIDPEIPARYAGQAYFFDHVGNVRYGAGATQFFSVLKSFSSLGQLISYGSTAHAAYHAARMLGCAPIVLIGNDLAFPGNRAYAAGAMQNELKRNDSKQETWLEVPANDGSMVRTQGLYKIYLNDFPELIRGTGGVVINVSHQGARIEGVPYQPLEEVLQRLPESPVDKRFLREHLTPGLAGRQAQFLDELTIIQPLMEKLLQKLERIRKRISYLESEDGAFRRQMIQYMREVVALNESSGEYRLLDLSASLCNRSIVSLIGQFGNLSVFGGETAAENEISRTRAVDFLKDLEQGLVTYRDAFLQAPEFLDEASGEGKSR